jgi:hypothetical protein
MTERSEESVPIKPRYVKRNSLSELRSSPYWLSLVENRVYATTISLASLLSTLLGARALALYYSSWSGEL